MKKQLMILASIALLASSCNQNKETTTQEAQVEQLETTEQATVGSEADSTEIETATTGIEEASAEVDSLLNEI